MLDYCLPVCNQRVVRVILDSILCISRQFFVMIIRLCLIQEFHLKHGSQVGGAAHHRIDGRLVFPLGISLIGLESFAFQDGALEL